MNRYRLKKGQPAFEIVDGPMTGHRFEPGVVYSTIPEHEKNRFETVKAKTSPAGPKKEK